MNQLFVLKSDLLDSDNILLQMDTLYLLNRGYVGFYNLSQTYSM
jgi:hypothetical protein